VPDTTEARTVSTVQIGPASAEQVTGMTYRQIDYACRKGLLKPLHVGGTGYSREWTHPELDVARLIGRLTAPQVGLSLETAARIARAGAGRHEIAPGIVIEVTT
jgi:DNA-binding transcriptional MerR regulator